MKVCLGCAFRVIRHLDDATLRVGANSPNVDPYFNELFRWNNVEDMDVGDDVGRFSVRVCEHDILAVLLRLEPFPLAVELAVAITINGHFLPVETDQGTDFAFRPEDEPAIVDF